MAVKKKMAAGKKKTTAKQRPVARKATQAPATAPPPGNPQQLMREAAWRGMFGIAGAKNPFTR